MYIRQGSREGNPDRGLGMNLLKMVKHTAKMKESEE
jgi:hypothetical protein